MAVVQVTDIAGDVAVGLTWRLLRGATTPNSEIAAIVKELGSPLGCQVRDTKLSQRMVGIASDVRTGVPSGAAWLAMASEGKAIVLAEPVGQDQVWICSVRAGFPVQDQDLLVDRSEYAARLRSILEESEGATLISTLDDIGQEFANVDGRSFAEITMLVKEGAIPSAVRIKRLSGTNPLLYAGLAVTALVVFGWPQLSAYLEQMKRKDALAQVQAISARRAAQDQATLESQRRDARARQDDEVRAAVTARPAPEVALASFLDAVGGSPVILGGWKMVSIDCTARSVCTVFWKRKPGATSLTFMEAAEGAGIEVADVSQDDARTTHAARANARETGLDAIPSAGSFALGLDSILQQLSDLGMKPSRKQPVRQPSIVAGATAKPGGAAAAGSAPGVGEEVVSPWSVGTITVKGAELMDAKAAVAALSHPAVALKSFGTDLEQKTWTLEFNYATK